MIMINIQKYLMNFIIQEYNEIELQSNDSSKYWEIVLQYADNIIGKR